MIKIKRTYQVTPNDSHVSFYGKAAIYVAENDVEYLRSYDTIVASRTPDGKLIRHWSGYSATTGRHLRAAFGIDKKAWDKMEVVPAPSFDKGKYSYPATSYGYWY